MGEVDDDFREFVVHRSPALCRVAYLLTGDHHLAEDLLQAQVARELGLTVATLDGSTSGTSFPVPVDRALGGKGAWTPDGRWLTLVERQGSGWALRYVDPVSDAATGGPATPVVAGMTAIRLLAWREDGSALVAAFEPRPGSPARFNQPLSLGRTRAADPPHGFGPRFWFWTGSATVTVASVYLFRRRWEILTGPSRWQFELVRRIR